MPPCLVQHAGYAVVLLSHLRYLHLLPQTKSMTTVPAAREHVAEIAAALGSLHPSSKQPPLDLHQQAGPIRPPVLSLK